LQKESHYAASQLLKEVPITKIGVALDWIKSLCAKNDKSCFVDHHIGGGRHQTYQ